MVSWTSWHNRTEMREPNPRDPDMGHAGTTRKAEIQAVYALCYTIVAPTMQQLQRSCPSSVLPPPTTRSRTHTQIDPARPHATQSAVSISPRTHSLRVRSGANSASGEERPAGALVAGTLHYVPGPPQVAPRRRSDYPQHSRRLRCRRGAAGAPGMDHMRMRGAHATTGILRWCGITHSR